MLPKCYRDATGGSTMTAQNEGNRLQKKKLGECYRGSINATRDASPPEPRSRWSVVAPAPILAGAAADILFGDSLTPERRRPVARTADISKALELIVTRTFRAEVRTDLRRLERRIAKLTEDLSRLARGARRSGSGTTTPHGPVSKGRQRHGRYIGLLRHLPKRAQAEVRAVRKRQGVDAAIKTAERLKK